MNAYEDVEKFLNIIDVQITVYIKRPFGRSCFKCYRFCESDNSAKEMVKRSIAVMEKSSWLSSELSSHLESFNNELVECTNKMLDQNKNYKILKDEDGKDVNEGYIMIGQYFLPIFEQRISIIRRLVWQDRQNLDDVSMYFKDRKVTFMQ